MDHEDAGAACRRVLDAVGGTVVADTAFLETVLTGILARGHVLLEDVPGTGKTLTARSFARTLDLSFRRIQFTPDLLPADNGCPGVAVAGNRSSVGGHGQNI